MNQQEEFKNCPFCNGNPEIITEPTGYSYIRCKKCSGRAYIKHWNYRFDTLVKKYKELIG